MKALLGHCGLLLKPQSISDPYWNNVVSLLRFNGAEGSTTFVDEKANTWTVNGGTPTITTSGIFGSSLNCPQHASTISNITTSLPVGLQIGTTQDFTVECFVRLSSLPSAGYNTIFFRLVGGISYDVGLYAGTTWNIWVNGGGLNGSGTTPTPQLNTTYHIAIVRQSGNISLFVNGNRQAAPFAGGSTGVTALYVGHSSISWSVPSGIKIDEFRVTNGVARYTANFTPPTAEFPTTGPLLYDPFWSNVTSLMHFNGTEGSSTIVDQRGLTWTQSAELMTLDTSVKKYGTSSIKALNAPAQRLALSTNAALGFGTGDYTIEFFVRANTLSSSSYAVIAQLNNGVLNHAVYLNNKNSFICRFAGAADVTKTGIVLDQWYHIAVTRASGLGYFFVDGQLVGSPTTHGDNFGTTFPAYLFASAAGGNLFKGHMDEFRVTKGVARYTANFTPPTQQFPDA